MRTARLHLRLTDSELATMEAHAAELGTSLSSLGHEWMQEFVANGTDLKPAPAREQRVQILIEPDDLVQAKRIAKTYNLDLQDVLRHYIEQLRQ